MKKPSLILVSGFPASGKSTIANEIANHFGLPTISKDEIKEFLSDNFQITEPEQTKQLNDFSRALVSFFSGKILKSSRSVVVDMNFNRKVDADNFRRIVNSPHEIFQVICRAPNEVLTERFRNRAINGNRHKVHPETQQDPDKFMSNFLEGADVIVVSDSTLNVDTTDFSKVDYTSIFNAIREKMPR